MIVMNNFAEASEWFSDFVKDQEIETSFEGSSDIIRTISHALIIAENSKDLADRRKLFAESILGAVNLMKQAGCRLPSLEDPIDAKSFYDQINEAYALLDNAENLAKDELGE